MNVLSHQLPTAFELFAEVLREPAFPEREVERLKAERLAEILQLRAEPRGLADEMFDSFLYARSSRYAIPEHGSETTVSSLGSSDVRAFHESRYRPAGMTLVVAGDVSVDEGRELAERTLGRWSGDVPPPGRADDAASGTTRQVRLVMKADAPQSELRIGHVGLPRAHPDYFPTLVMNSVLGGLFSSRINLNLREAHGYTYGAFSGFDWRRGAGPFVVSTAVRSDVTVAATREVVAEIDRIREAEISADELSLAVSYLDGVFPIRYETTSAIARALAALIVYELPEDYFDSYRSNIRSVSREEVLRVARAHLHPEALQILVVGDPSVVRGSLEEAGFGQLSTHQP
jgi:zinc protease